MKAKIINNDFSRDIYNKVANHPLQTWEWGEARREMGIDVLRIGEFDKDTLQNVFQVTFHTLPYIGMTVGYLPRSVFPSREVIELIKKEAKKRNAIFVKLEPDVKLSDKESIDTSDMISSGHPLFPEWTQVLDITKSEEDLLKGMKSKTRYNARLAQKKGVTIKEMTGDEGFSLFSKLYFATTERQKYRGHTPGYHKIVFSHLKRDISHILVATYKDKPLAAYHLFLWKDTLYYPYGGSSSEHRNLMATNALMWEAIRFGKKHGAKKFDMWGSLPSDYDRSNSWAGFTRFKEGYGTEFVQFIGSYDIVMNKLMYGMYNVANLVRKKLM